MDNLEINSFKDPQEALDIIQETGIQQLQRRPEMALLLLSLTTLNNKYLCLFTLRSECIDTCYEEAYSFSKKHANNLHIQQDIKHLLQNHSSKRCKKSKR